MKISQKYPTARSAILKGRTNTMQPALLSKSDTLGDLSWDMPDTNSDFFLGLGLGLHHNAACRSAFETAVFQASA